MTTDTDKAASLAKRLRQKTEGLMAGPVILSQSFAEEILASLESSHKQATDNSELAKTVDEIIWRHGAVRSSSELAIVRDEVKKAIESPKQATDSQIEAAVEALRVFNHKQWKKNEAGEFGYVKVEFVRKSEVLNLLRPKPAKKEEV
jgi:hypothetical protein